MSLSFKLVCECPCLDDDALTNATDVISRIRVMSSFSDFSLDDRLSRAVTKLLGSSAKPSLIQASAIPLALKGKDIVAHARTGSGKTLAYLIPILNKLLNSPSNGICCIILVPTKELVNQVSLTVQSLSIYSSREISLVNSLVQNSLLSESKNQIVVATPTKLLSLLESKFLSCQSTLHSLVLDEADLLLSYGYEQDIRKLLPHFPSIYQSYLMSATMTEEIIDLKKLFVRNPAVLTLKDTHQDTLHQFCLSTTSQHRYLHLFYLLKLKVHPFGDKKVIIFTNDIDSSYRIKLFLEQFGIRSCVLNHELPLNSRLSIVQEFNKGVYDIIVATDAAELDNDSDSEQDAPSKPKENKKSKKSKKTKDSSISRGIDFQNVQCVINFDLPPSTRTYMHRIGRTARANSTGYSLSFVQADNEKITSKDGSLQSYDEYLFARIQKSQERLSRTISQFQPDSSIVKSFEYRVEDASRSVTKQHIKEARLKHIKAEILGNEVLKTHFEENPGDKEILRHDKCLGPRVLGSLRHVPDYLLPNRKRANEETKEEKKVDFGEIKYKERKKRIRKEKKKSNDPLKTFKM